MSYEKIEAAIREYKENEAQEWMSETPEQHTARVLCEWTERLCDTPADTREITARHLVLTATDGRINARFNTKHVSGATLIDALANMLEALRADDP